MEIKEVKKERTQLEMAIDDLIVDFNKRTESFVTAIHVTYSYSSLAKENRPDINVEVKL